MKSSVRSGGTSCTDMFGQCLNCGDYVMNMCFTIAKGRIKPPGRCYKLSSDPKLREPRNHLNHLKRIAPREELLLNHLGISTPAWLAARIIHQILARIQIEQPACAAEESEKWRHQLNDAVVSIITHRAGTSGREIEAGSAGDRSAGSLGPRRDQPEAAATPSQKRSRRSAGTPGPLDAARGGSSGLSARRPSAATRCEGREGEGKIKTNSNITHPKSPGKPGFPPVFSSQRFRYLY